MATIDKTYHELLDKILREGYTYEDPNRRGTSRLEISKYNFEHDLRESFPAVTTKELFFKGVVGELLWFLRGETNIKPLLEEGINIWNKDAYNHYCSRYRTSPDKAREDGFFTFEEYISNVKNRSNPHTVIGDLGRVYGAQMRYWGDGVDQISNLIKSMKEKPFSTEHIVTMWNPSEIRGMALPPCHKGFQIMVYPLNETHIGHILELGKDVFGEHNKVWEGPKYGFDLVWEQRSVDTFLGLPFNIASYALLAHMIGLMTNMEPGMLYGDLRNVHIYEPHTTAVGIQLERDVNKYPNIGLNVDEGAVVGLSKFENNIDKKMSTVKTGDFTLDNYQCYSKLKAEMLAYKK